MLAVRQSPPLKKANAIAVAIRTSPTAQASRANGGRRLAGAWPCTFDFRLATLALLLAQPFGLHRLLDGRARGDALHVGLDVGPRRKVDLVDGGPPEHGVEIGVGDAELAHQVLARSERLVEVVEPLAEALEPGLAPFGRHLRVEEVAERLVDLGSDEVDPFDQLVA